MIELDDFENNGETSFLPLLQTKWKKILNIKDVFRYRVDYLQEKFVAKYLLQLNPNRGVNRRNPEHIDNIRQPFNKDKFNFTKVSSDEIMYQVKTADSADVHTIIVNVSPISLYHSLLCPSINSCFPQVVTRESLELALQIMFIAEDRSIRIGFNSLCALASVNHLHYHILVEARNLPVETWPCHQIKGPLYCLNNDYPIPAFCFEVTTRGTVNRSSELIFRLLQHLINNSIAHNILLTRGNSVCTSTKHVVRVLIWARKSTTGAKQLSAFNVAVCELSGWFPVYSEKYFKILQKEDLEKELKKWRLDNFEEVCESLKLLF